MERLSCSGAAPYGPIEAAVHVSRYAGAVALSPGKRVLDIACGEGYGTYLMARAGAAEVTGIDVSETAIAACAAQFPHPALRFLAGDASALDALLGNAQFDLIVSLETIEHLGDPLGFLRALRRRCAPGGTIILSCPNDHWYYRPGQQNPYHIRKYSFAEFRALAEEVLGAADAWYLGTAALGFATVPIDDLETGRSGADYADVRPAPAAYRCRPGEDDPVAPANGSYFLGAWGPGATAAQGAAVFPLSMDRYARLLQTADLATLLSTETSARERLQAALQTADAALSGQRQAAETRLAEAGAAAAAMLDQVRLDHAAKLATADAALAGSSEALHRAESLLAEERQRADQDLRLTRVQVHALRRENAILLESISRLKGSVTSHAATIETERLHHQQRATDLVAARDAAAALLDEMQALTATNTARLEAARAGLLEEREFLLAERERIFARMRPVWRLAQMIPPPVRRGMRRVAGPMLRRLASQA